MSATPAQAAMAAIATHLVDAAIVVCDKPADLLAVPGRGEEKHDCVMRRLERLYGALHIVHRLDMATSGLMVFARTADALRHLHRQFREGLVHKAYEAIVVGSVGPGERVIDVPIMRDWSNRPRQKIDFAQGKRALTRMRALCDEAGQGGTRVHLEPLTGRTHQLRLHMQHIGHPIVGDEWYGEGAQASRLLLHAKRLCFAHPVSNARLQFSSSVPF